MYYYLMVTEIFVMMQGSAADLCKAAMVTLHDGVPSAFPDAPKACRLVLQARLCR